MKPQPDRALFAPGTITCSQAALDAIRAAGITGLFLLARHITGDWGDLCEEDVAENRLSVEQGFRILSSYELETGEKIWLITEADRSATTFLLPSEY